MIRVLQLPDSIEKRNGRMSVIMNVYRKIDRSKIQFDFACTDYGFENYQDEIRQMGGKVYILPQKDLSFSKIKKLITNLLTSGQYSYLHYHALSKWGCALAIAHKFGVRTIVHSHATKMSDTVFKSIRNRIFSLPLFLYADKKVAVSPEAGETLFLGTRFEYIPNMINYKKFVFDPLTRNRIRDLYNINPETVLIGCVGRISKQKNQKYAIEVLNRLVRDYSKKIKLMIVGDAEEKDSTTLSKLYSLIKMYNLNKNVIFTGMVDNIADYYSAFDLFWLPSLYEGMPTAGVEAETNGLSLIVSNTVSKDLNVTGNVKFLSIKRKNIYSWELKTLESLRFYRCKNALAMIENSEYNTNKIISSWKKLYGV